MTRNFEALRALRDTLDFAPAGTHDQNHWGEMLGLPSSYETYVSGGNTEYIVATCTSSACAAGWAVTNAGDKMLFFKEALIEGAANSFECVDKEGTVKAIPVRARELLGITKLQATLLFDDWYTTPQVVEMIDVLLKEDVSNSVATNQLKAKVSSYE